MGPSSGRTEVAGVTCSGYVLLRTVYICTVINFIVITENRSQQMWARLRGELRSRAADIHWRHVVQLRYALVYFDLYQRNHFL